MKTLLAIALLLVATFASANGPLEKDSRYGAPIQGFTPNGLYSSLLTVNSTTVNGTTLLGIAIYTPIDAKVRFMATSSKNGSVSHMLIGGLRTTFIINRTTPFVNISGATGGDYLGM